MKKLFLIFLSVVFLLQLFVFVSFAEEAEKEAVNISPLGTAYCSSEKNSLWTPVKTISNGKYGTEDWQGWECSYPTVKPGEDTSNGFSGEFCGIKFGDNYYNVTEIKMNIGLHTLMGGQNATYNIQALVLGNWVTIATLTDDMAVPTSEKYADYNAVMADDEASHRVNANLSVKLDNAVTTNNIRVVVSDYAKGYPGGDILIFPYIYELEIYGTKGEAPDVILPEGAKVITDIAWYSYPEATTTQRETCPYYAIDGKNDTYWSPEISDGQQFFILNFDKEYEIGKISIAFDNDDILGTVLHTYTDGKWERVVGGSFERNETGYTANYNFPATKATAVRLQIRKSEEIPKITSFEAHLSDTKTYAFDSRFTEAQLKSVLNGNLAILSTPYAKVDFIPYSDISFITDGEKVDSKVWFTGTVDMQTYCGVTFDYPQKISKAVLTVRTPSQEGKEVIHFEIYALLNGEYVKLSDGRSYDAEQGYTTTHTFDEVETTDIRIVYTRGSGAIPNLMELELYSKDEKPHSMFDGVVLEKQETENTKPPQIITPTVINVDEPNTTLVVCLSIGGAVVVLAIIVVLLLKKKRGK